MENNNFDIYNTYAESILRSLRRIIRAVDVHSHKLKCEFNITTPQMLCLCSLARKNEQTLSELAEDINLGVSTVNGIVDRLESKSLLTRTRSTLDRRKVVISITESGVEIVSNAPSLLQDKFSLAISRLSALEQARLSLTLERIVKMMCAERIES